MLLKLVCRTKQTHRPAAFREKELVDLTIAISLMDAYNRLAISFRDTPLATIKNYAHGAAPNAPLR